MLFEKNNRGWLWFAFLFGIANCAPSSQSPTSESKTQPPVVEKGWFVEVAESSGLLFEHQNGATGQFNLPEIMGAGSALFDYDRDGDLDVYVVQSGPFPPKSTSAISDKLFRNDTPKGATPDQILFTDVTSESGLDQTTGYGMGVAVADIDRDGWLDLYVTNYGDNQLWRNRGDGSFENITQTSGANDSQWSISASFCDFDNDGWPDLLIGNYVAFLPENHEPCVSSTVDYCHPRTYPPQTDTLLRNLGNGQFENVTQASGLSQRKGRTLGVLSVDFNGDQLQDFYIANDAMANFLWLNQGDGTFKEAGLFAGVALNLTGQPEGSMGVDAADFDEDGDEDLFITHLRKETNTLYCNDGNAQFEDCSNPFGLGQASLPYTGFGTGWADFNRDGLLDLFVSNGSVAILEDLAKAGDANPYHQTNQLFVQYQRGKFRDETAKMGASMVAHSEVSRGAAFGDIDNDGDTDILVTNNQGKLRLYVNRSNPQNAWLGFQLEQNAGAPFLGNTKVKVTMANGRVLHRRFRQDGSYLSANDGRIIIGLGTSGSATQVDISWPNQTTTTLTNPVPNQYNLLAVPDSLKGKGGK